MLNTIAENRILSRLTAGFQRSPLQLNRQHQSDAEILLVPCQDGARLAITTDTLAEEIESGLYADPWFIGWMTVMVNLSDLAAVGARPLGLVVAETIPHSVKEDFVAALQQGIADACVTSGTYVLGGDTNSGPILSMSASALGLLEGGRMMTRIGCAPGESVFVSGPLGGGSTYAFARWRGSTTPPYRPVARLREGTLVRSHASCCMDTSDGLLATLDQLMRLNNLGFVLERGWESALTQESRTLARHLGVPDWFMVAGEHGEFELVFTVPETGIQTFLAQADALAWRPVKIGHVTTGLRILACTENGETPLDTGAIRNCGVIARQDIGAYLEALRGIAAGGESLTGS